MGIRRPLAEGVIWMAVLVAVFVFTPQLFTEGSLADEPTWRKAIKDIPLVALFAVALLNWRGWGERGLATLDRRFLVAAGALAAFMTIDFIVRTPELAGFLVSARYYLVYPLVALAVLNIDLSREAIQRIVVALCVLGVFESLIAVYEFAKVVPDTYYANYVDIGDEMRPRAIGTLGDPNNLGLFLALPALLLAAGAVGRGALRWVVFGLTLVGIALTFSKGAAISITAAVVLIEWLGGRGRRALRLIPPIAVGLLLFGIALTARFGGELTAFSIFSDRGGVTEEAFNTWTSDLTSFLVGEGFGSQVDVVAGEIVPTTTDNMFLMLALEGGLLAILVFGAVVALGFVGFLRAWRAERSRLTLAFLAYAFCFLLYSPFLVNFRLYPAAFLFWLTLGMALRLSISDRGASTASS